MQTSVTFKNIDPSDHLKAYVGDKLSRLDKYLYNPAEANVVLSVEKFRHIADVNIIGDRLSINGKEETSDMYSAIDMVLDKIEKQIKKSKQKTRNRRNIDKSLSSGTYASPASTADTVKTKTPQINMMHIDYKPMDIEEAALQIDLDDNNFIVFTNARTNRVNVIYKQTNGDYGLIQPRT